MELMADAITTHVYAIYIFLIIMLYNGFLVLSAKDNFIKTAKKLRFMTPIYHVTNAIVAYTGGIIAAYTHNLSFTVILMIATSILVMVLEIKRYKKMRVIKSEQIVEQEEFYKFSKKIYTIEIVALVFTFIVSKIF